MSTYDIEVDPKDFPKTTQVRSDLQRLGSNHAHLLAMFLVGLQNKYGVLDSMDAAEAFVKTAIESSNKYGHAAFPGLDTLYRGLVNPPS